MSIKIKNCFILAILAVSLSPFSASAATVSKKPVTTTPYVTAEDQQAVKNTVVIKELYSPANGWIVLHQSVENTPSMVVGHAFVKKGINKDVKVTISRPKDITPKLFAMLHTDKGKKGKFEFPPGIDNPLLGKDREPVMMEFTLLK